MAPPLYNLFLGAALSLFGARSVDVFAIVYMSFGLGASLGLYLLMRALGASVLLATALTIGFVVSPATILYENWLYPDYLITALLIAMSLLVKGFATSGRWSAAVGFAALLGVIVLSRSYYQVIWFILCIAALLLTAPHRKRIALAALIPLLLIVGLFARNYLMWGFFSGSSSTGLNFYNEFIVQLPLSDRAQLKVAGVVSDIAVQPELYLAHPQAYGLHPATGVPVLDEVYKSSGVVNYGNLTYVAIWMRMQRDGMALIEARPIVLERAAVMATLIFFDPSQEYPLEPDNRRHLGGLERMTDLLESGQLRTVQEAPRVPAAFSRSHWADRLGEVGWLTVVIYVLAVPYGLIRTWRSVRNGDHQDAAVLAFLLVTIVYVIGADLSAGVPDNNRYRFMIDPLVLAIFAALVTDAAKRLRIARLTVRGQEPR
jgi:hypothetical protein